VRCPDKADLVLQALRRLHDFAQRRIFPSDQLLKLTAIEREELQDADIQFRQRPSPLPAPRQGWQVRQSGRLCLDVENPGHALDVFVHHRRRLGERVAAREQEPDNCHRQPPQQIPGPGNRPGSGIGLTIKTTVSVAANAGHLR
jgi:hypothetical protein